MKWEDTVIQDMTPYEIREGMENFIDGEKLAKAQAEISFKAGYNQALKEHEWDDNYYKGKKAGMQTVVDWLEGCMLREHCDTKDKGVFCRDYRVYDGEWRLKKKEWGIE